MNWLDLVIAAPLLWFGYKGFQQGIIMQIVFIIGILFGLYGALQFSDLVAQWLQDTEFKDWARYTAFIYLATFIACFLLVRLVGKMIEKTVQLTGLSFLNKAVGLALGLAKGLLLVSGLLLAINAIDQQNTFASKPIVADSLLYAPVSSICPYILPIVQSSSWTQGLEKVEETVNAATEI